MVKPVDVVMSVVVARYVAPFSIVLVGLGLLFSDQSHATRVVCGLLVAFSFVVDVASMDAIGKNPDVLAWLPEARMNVILANNVLLIYLLDDAWPTMWLLLALTPFSVAVYDTRRRTLSMTALVSLLMVAMHFLKGAYTPLRAAMDVARIAFIALGSLMLNDIARLAQGTNAPPP